MLKKITDALITDLDGLSFGPPVTHTYNPLVYARAPWDLYCDKYGRGAKSVLLVGMNPGPWGMSQTGVPFGEIELVRDWMGIEAEIGRPALEHPKRPIEGFDCHRREVSGRRLWGWAKEGFGSAESFFERFFVVSYCPLVFMEESGRNRVPEKLPRAEREPVFLACDRALRKTVEQMEPRFVVGVGKFAEKRARACTAGLDVRIAAIPHPSPASPRANKDWAGQATRALHDAGIAWPGGPTEV